MLSELPPIADIRRFTLLIAVAPHERENHLAEHLSIHRSADLAGKVTADRHSRGHSAIDPAARPLFRELPFSAASRSATTLPKHMRRAGCRHAGSAQTGWRVSVP